MSDPTPLLSGTNITGHLREFTTDPLGLLTRFNHECGDIGRVKFATIDLTVVNEPRLVAEFLVEKAKGFRKSRALRAALHPLVGDGLFTSDGALWQRQRKLMAPIFQPAHLGDFASDMVACAVRSASGWRDGDPIDLARETTRITMSIAGKTLFDSDTFAQADALGEALTVALEWSAKEAASLSLGVQVELAAGLDRVAGHLPGPLAGAASKLASALEQPILWPGERSAELKRAIAVLDERVSAMIAERRASKQERHDLLSRLLHARDEEGGVMTDRQLRDEVVTLFVAGHETTATALAWSFYLLARHPSVREKLEEEVAALGNRDPGAEDAAALPLTRRVFQEALRMYPPVPVYERETLDDIELGGRTYPRGAYVAVFPWALHHRPEVWPEPDRFDPGRFLDDAEKQRHRYAYVPFGAGPRVCIGNHFALLEGTLVLATLARRARFELVGDAPIDVDPAAATLRPKGGMPMRVVLR